MHAFKRLEVEHDHPSVRAARHQDVRRSVDLDLPDQRRVALEERQQVARLGRPDAYGRVEAAGGDPETVKGDRVDGMVMATEDPQTLALSIRSNTLSAAFSQQTMGSEHGPYQRPKACSSYHSSPILSCSR